MPQELSIRPISDANAAALVDATLEDLVGLGSLIGAFAGAAVYDNIHHDDTSTGAALDKIEDVESAARRIDERLQTQGVGGRMALALSKAISALLSTMHLEGSDA